MSTATKANASSITATSQHSLRQLVRTQINEYSRLTQLLFTNLEILADGKTPPAQPNDIMKQIVQLDATLMGAVEKSMDKTERSQKHCQFGWSYQQNYFLTQHVGHLHPLVELHQRQQRRIRQVRLEIEDQNKAIMEVIQSLRSAKQVLELNLENLEEKRAASADARSGTCCSGRNIHSMKKAR